MCPDQSRSLSQARMGRTIRPHLLCHKCQQQGYKAFGEVILLHHVVQHHQGAIQTRDGLDLVFTLQIKVGELQSQL